MGLGAGMRSVRGRSHSGHAAPIEGWAAENERWAMNQLLFVYGTLKQGFDNHNLMKGSYFIGTGRTAEKYAMYKHVVPYVLKGQPITPIHGEVYSVHQSLLETLDIFEGNPVWNCREQVDVILDADGSTVSAWMYFNDTPVGELVESGVYTRY